MSEDKDYQRLLPPAILSEKDEFYAECNIQGINLVDRVNGKPVYVYPYWIDRPNCNWHSPLEPEDDEECFMHYGDEDDEDDKDKDANKDGGNEKGLFDGLKRLWHRHKQQS